MFQPNSVAEKINIGSVENLFMNMTGNEFNTCSVNNSTPGVTGRSSHENLFFKIGVLNVIW